AITGKIADCDTAWRHVGDPARGGAETPIPIAEQHAYVVGAEVLAIGDNDVRLSVPRYIPDGQQIGGKTADNARRCAEIVFHRIAEGACAVVEQYRHAIGRREDVDHHKVKFTIATQIGGGKVTWAAATANLALSDDEASGTATRIDIDK